MSKPQPNAEMEQLYDQLYPKPGQPTITFDYYTAQELVLELLASRKEVNTSREKARVEQALGEQKEAPAPKQVEKATTASTAKKK